MSDSIILKNLEIVETKVCEYFGVSQQDIVNFTHRQPASLARSYVFYIAHCDLYISINNLSKTYHRKTRGLFKSIAKIKYLITNQKKYKNIYVEIKNKILTLIE